MRIPFFLLLAVNSLLVSSGTLLMRQGGRNIDWSRSLAEIVIQGRLWFVGLIACWVAGLAFALFLTRHEVVTTFATYACLTYIFIVLGGFVLLGEQASPSKILGAGLSLLGMYLLIKD